MRRVTRIFLFTFALIPMTLSQNFLFPQDSQFRPHRQSLGGFDWNVRPNFRNKSPGRIIFPGDDEFPNPQAIRNERTTTRRTTVAVPGMGTRRPLCEEKCLSTHEFNPVCGTDMQTYDNPTRLSCAQRCGKRISISYYGSCAKNG